MTQQYKTKEFWLQVQEEFEENPSHFLCWASDTFGRAFNNIATQEYFADLAETFLNEQQQWAKHFESLKGHCLLFKAHDPANTTNALRQQLRKEFVDWTIQQFNKNDKTANSRKD